MSALKTTAHLLLYSLSFGGVTYYSYVASPIAFKSLPREQFSALQSHVFPQFFITQAIAPIFIGLTSPFALTTAGLSALAIGAVSGLANSIWLLPKTKALKEERLKYEEGSDEYKQLSKEFGKWHGVSLLFNLTWVLSVGGFGVGFAKNIAKIIPK
ncbi:hypothetical protein WICPIJ_000314 [Wickerhamomyces pijperi]|uniref:TMEM205-like domain-containing protein n=1 Tax=Wickerhamomyces pijperi TaxID=599730 RepID=A0A9P8TS78_WICPI|nr:hypothetical protein WICPIJ_000314 [Wickerhamomyces pijperi]